MTKVEQRFPLAQPSTVDDVVAALRREPADGPLRPGDTRVVDYLAIVARKLLAPSIARRFPELGSLGFFLRRGELDRALARVAAGHGQVRVPRGLVFHVPPANVDTIFVYSWALSALAGNHNLVRISPRSAGAASAVLDVLNEALADAHPAIAETQRMLTYGRDDDVTARLSAACDLRVIWGGDRSVTEIRKFPLRPLARDVVFPDRSSFCVISATAWAQADAKARRGVAEGLYNDSFWFDQAACSSPRAIYWVGDEASVGEAPHELFGLVAEVAAQKAVNLDAAMAIEKRVSTYGLAIDAVADRLTFDTNAVAEVRLTDPVKMPRRWLGTGTFPYARVAHLNDLASMVERRDQTVTHFGFSAGELTNFVHAVAGRGIDRLVPIGEALSFAPVWDGYDLLREFTKLTVVQVDLSGIGA